MRLHRVTPGRSYCNTAKLNRPPVRIDYAINPEKTNDGGISQFPMNVTLKQYWENSSYMAYNWNMIELPFYLL